MSRLIDMHQNSIDTANLYLKAYPVEINRQEALTDLIAVLDDHADDAVKKYLAGETAQ